MSNFNFLFNFLNFYFLIIIYIYNITKINRRIITINFSFFYISNIINWIIFFINCSFLLAFEIICILSTFELFLSIIFISLTKPEVIDLLILLIMLSTLTDSLIFISSYRIVLLFILFLIFSELLIIFLFLQFDLIFSLLFIITILLISILLFWFFLIFALPLILFLFFFFSNYNIIVCFAFAIITIYYFIIFFEIIHF